MGQPSVRGGWHCPPTPRRTTTPKTFTRGEIAGFAEVERQCNAWFGHGDQPSDSFWQRELAKIDAALAVQGSQAA